MKFNLSVLIIVLLSSLSSAQTKQEKEERISIKDFPVRSKQFIKELPQNVKRLKLFREDDGGTTSYEAKFKLGKKFYSVEFDVNGTLEDIEVLIKEQELSESTLKHIEDILNSEYQWHRLLRIQEQYVNSSRSKALAFLMDIVNSASTIRPNYEIIVESKSKKKRELFELTIDFDGKLLAMRPIVPSSYDYVLY